MRDEICAYASVFVLLLLVAGCSGGPNADAPMSQYAGQEGREIKALSAQEVDGYLEGQGMGVSKVAELNQHPGPKHVLAMAEELQLTEGQYQRVAQAFRQMKGRARALGRQLVAKERQLDSTFASGSAGEVETEALLREIGALEAQLRFTHVQAHMQTKAMLSPRQVGQYDELRGYGGSGSDPDGHGSHRHGA